MKPSKFKKYKAIIFDVDGTLILNAKEALPSEVVKESIRKATEKIILSIATSRPLPYVIQIIELLKLKSPLIVNAGTQIYDPISKKIIWQKAISKSSARKVIDVFYKFKIDLWTNDGIDQDILCNNLLPSFECLQFWAGNMSSKKAEEIIKELEKIPNIVPHKIPSWSKGLVDLVITHSEASKQHGVLQLAKILKVKTKDFIGVGDGYNDFPLLMACGLKVAMGNAVQELKEIADYIAPSVEDDGVVDVIEKFILNETN